MAEPLEGVIVEPDYVAGGSSLIDYSKGNEELSVYFEDERDVEHRVSFIAGDPFERGLATIPLEAAVALAKAILSAAAKYDDERGTAWTSPR